MFTNGRRAGLLATALPLLTGCAPATAETHASYYIWSFAISGLAAVAYAAGNWRVRRGG